MRVNQPVLWRRPGELQVGTSPSRAVVLRDLTPAETALLLDLARPRTRAWLDAALEQGGITPDRWGRLWRAVMRATTPPAPEETPIAGAVVALLDRHPLTVAAGRALGEAGTRVVQVPLDGTPEEPAPGARAPHLAILTDSRVTDPVRVAPLMRHDVAHLPVVVDDDGVSVGPVVTPGVGPCSRCLDLARAGGDDAWPALATQLRLLPWVPLAGATAGFAPAVVAWAAAGHLAGKPPRGWRITDREIIPIAPVAVHPDCTCAGLTPPCGAGPGPV